MVTALQFHLCDFCRTPLCGRASAAAARMHPAQLHTVASAPYLSVPHRAAPKLAGRAGRNGRTPTQVTTPWGGVVYLDAASNRNGGRARQAWGSPGYAAYHTPPARGNVIVHPSHPLTAPLLTTYHGGVLVPTKYAKPPEERMLTRTEQVPTGSSEPTAAVGAVVAVAAVAAVASKPPAVATSASLTPHTAAQVEKELDKTGELVRAAQAELKLVHEELAIERLESEVCAARPRMRPPHACAPPPPGDDDRPCAAIRPPQVPPRHPRTPSCLHLASPSSFRSQTSKQAALDARVEVERELDAGRKRLDAIGDVTERELAQKIVSQRAVLEQELEKASEERVRTRELAVENRSLLERLEAQELAFDEQVCLHAWRAVCMSGVHDGDVRRCGACPAI